jgi:hypothetical protein
MGLPVALLAGPAFLADGNRYSRIVRLSSAVYPSIEFVDRNFRRILENPMAGQAWVVGKIFILKVVKNET